MLWRVGTCGHLLAHGILGGCLPLWFPSSTKLAAGLQFQLWQMSPADCMSMCACLLHLYLHAWCFCCWLQVALWDVAAPLVHQCCRRQHHHHGVWPWWPDLHHNLLGECHSKRCSHSAATHVCRGWRQSVCLHHGRAIHAAVSQLVNLHVLGLSACVFACRATRLALWM